MVDVAVRMAVAEDAAAMAAIHIRSWQKSYAHLFDADWLAGFDIEARTKGWQSMLEHPAPGYRAFVAEESGVLLGFASWGPGRGRDKPYEHELFTLYLEPDRVGTGVGRLLMDTLLTDMRAALIPGAFLWVFEDNPRVRKFYETAGWHADGAQQSARVGTASPRQIRYRIDFS